MKANELRIGNLIEYLVYPDHSQEEEWVENYVDIQDLQWLNEHPDDKHYRPMKLTEELLKRFGFEQFIDFGRKSGLFDKKPLCGFSYSFNTNQVMIMKAGNNYWIPAVLYVHQLQNLYFTITGEELQLKEGEKL